MSVSTFFESIAKGIVNDAKKVKAAFEKVIAAEPTIEKDIVKMQPIIQAVLEEVSPQAAAIETAVYAGAGLIMKAIDDLGIAAVAKFLNIAENSQVLQDIKNVIPTVKSVAAAKGQIPALPPVA